MEIIFILALQAVCLAGGVLYMDGKLSFRWPVHRQNRRVGSRLPWRFFVDRGLA